MQAIDAMCEHADTARLLTRVLRRIERTGTIYSRVVNYALDHNTDPSRRAFIKYGRQRGNGKEPRYMIGRWLQDRTKNEGFQGLMEHASQRAGEIKPPPRSRKRRRDNLVARQAERNLLAAQQYHEASPAVPTPPPKVTHYGHSITTLLKPEQLQALRAEYFTEHAGFIAMLDHAHLAQGIVDLSPFPAVQEPHQGPAIPLLITAGNMLTVGETTLKLDGRQNKIANILLLLKGQPILVKELVLANLTTQDIYESGAALCRAFGVHQPRQDRPFYNAPVWGDQALQASPRLAIFDLRDKVEKHPIFQWDTA